MSIRRPLRHLQEFNYSLNLLWFSVQVPFRTIPSAYAPKTRPQTKHTNTHETHRAPIQKLPVSRFGPAGSTPSCLACLREPGVHTLAEAVLGGRRMGSQTKLWHACDAGRVYFEYFAYSFTVHVSYSNTHTKVYILFPYAGKCSAHATQFTRIELAMMAASFREVTARLHRPDNKHVHLLDGEDVEEDV